MQTDAFWARSHRSFGEADVRRTHARENEHDKSFVLEIRLGSDEAVSSATGRKRSRFSTLGDHGPTALLRQAVNQ